MDLDTIVSIVATVSTVGLFCTGIPICAKIVRKSSSTESSFFPFLAMFCNSFVWFRYGLIKMDVTIILVNSIGATLSAVYMGIYLFFTLQKLPVYRQLFMGCCVLLPSLAYASANIDNKEQTLTFLGSLAAMLGVVSYGAPLAAVAEVVRTQSTECMAFPLSLANFIVALEWLFYAYLKKDIFMKVPNGLGAILGSIQVSLFVIYPAKSSRTIAVEPDKVPLQTSPQQPSAPAKS